MNGSNTSFQPINSLKDILKTAKDDEDYDVGNETNVSNKTTAFVI